MLLYYITDRKQFPGNESDRRRALLRRITEAASCEIDLLQLHESDLSSRDLESLASEAVELVRGSSKHTRLLIHSRIDVALAVGTDGVHLDSDDPTAADARAIWAASPRARSASAEAQAFVIGVSCRSVADVRMAESQGADFVILSPIFESRAGNTVLGANAVALAALRNTPPDRRVEAGDHRIGVPVIAKGGVTAHNAAQCLRAGAAGVAATRLFQLGDLRQIVSGLRRIDQN